MAKQEFSLTGLPSQIPTEADAYLLLEKLRWGGQPDACPKCGSVGTFYFLNPENGTSRKTRTGSASQRRVWKCGACRKQFSVLTDTIFHGTKISIRTWLLVIFEFCSSKNSLSAHEVARKYSITNESAWHMLHRIREATKREPLAGLLRGSVQASMAMGAAARGTIEGMEAQQEQRWAAPTPAGWLAGSTVFPRIAVFGESEDDARARLDERCRWWRSIPLPENGPHDE